jgi:hypothetical protein
MEITLTDESRTLSPENALHWFLFERQRETRSSRSVNAEVVHAIGVAFRERVEACRVIETLMAAKLLRVAVQNQLVPEQSTFSIVKIFPTVNGKFIKHPSIEYRTLSKSRNYCI